MDPKRLLKREAIGGILSVALWLWPQTGWSLQVTDRFRVDGFVTQGYLKTTGNSFLHADSRGTFDLSAYDLVIQADVSGRFRVWSKLLTNSDLKDSVVLDWAFGEYVFTDAVRVKMGKMPMPVGIYNEIHHLFPVLPTTIVPAMYLHSTHFSPEVFKGLSVGGHMRSGAWGVHYDVLAGKSTGTDPQSLDADNMVGIRFWLHPPISELRVGLSFFRGVLKAGPENHYPAATYVTSIEYHSPVGFNIRGEWGYHEHYGGSMKNLDYYVEATYLIQDRWMPVVRYEAFFPVRGETSGIADYRKDWTVGLNARLTDYFVWKGEVHFMYGVARLDPLENPDPEGRWHLFATSVSFLF